MLLALIGGLAGCGGSGERGSAQSGAGGDAQSQAGTGSEQASREPPLPPRFRCPPAQANCATARGRIIYVEAVDPDGDGDAHFVLDSEESVTLSGISVIDVAVGLRPEPLPGPGDTISAVGPVYTGSFGQSQIQATAVRYRRSERSG